MNTFMP